MENEAEEAGRPQDLGGLIRYPKSFGVSPVAVGEPLEKAEQKRIEVKIWLSETSLWLSVKSKPTSSQKAAVHPRENW